MKKIISLAVVILLLVATAISPKMNLGDVKATETVLVSGFVSYFEEPLVGVNVVLFQYDTKNRQKTVTDSDGHYVFEAEPGYNYRVRPAEKKFVFTPRNYKFEVEGDTDFVLNFLADTK